MRCCWWLNIVNGRRCAAISVLKKTDLSKLKLVGRRDGSIHDHSRWIRPIYRHQFTIQFCPSLLFALRNFCLSKCGSDDLRYPETSKKNWNKFKEKTLKHTHMRACARETISLNWRQSKREGGERERERNFKRKRMWVRMKNKIHKEKHRWAFSVRDNVWWSTYRLCYAVCVLGSRFVLFTKTEWTRTTIIDEKKNRTMNPCVCAQIPNV